MIKRNGVTVMNDRAKNVSIAKETIDVCKNGKYTSLNGNVIDISVDLTLAKLYTVYYVEGVPDRAPTIATPLIPIIEVTNETTAKAAVRLGALGKTNIVALNFASACNQGGGFLSGALAQEEDLCRASGLYPCLKSKALFYNANILCDNSYYTDGVIYSPKVPFFRDEHNLFLDNPFTLSIISSPAPNLRGIERPSDEEDPEDDFGAVIYATLLSRAEKILNVAAHNGHKNIILGAWGCGAFGNDPGQVAGVFHEALTKVPAFEHVCFAVYDTRTPPHIFEAFQNVYK